MIKANIIIMGKTGAGKSTIVNTVLNSNIAEVGMGGAVTHENIIYNKVIGDIDFYLYDTVGLEIDSAITKSTLNEIRNRIKESNKNSSYSDVNIIWYCINPNINRFENFESKLISELIYTYEVPFIIVLTQSYSKNKTAMLKNSILKQHPYLSVIPILAEDYETDCGNIVSYGIEELLSMTINNYNSLKIELLNSKMKAIESKINIIDAERENDLNRKIKKANEVIEKNSKAAFAIGCIPGFSLFSFQPTYIAALTGISHALGVSLDSDAIENIAVEIIASIVFSPFFAIPCFSGCLASEILKDQAAKYLDALIAVVRLSEPYELRNSRIMSERIKNEIKKRKGE